MEQFILENLEFGKYHGLGNDYIIINDIKWRIPEEIKTSLALRDWMDEENEEYILENYNIPPGELHVKRDLADWILYSTEELAKLMNFRNLIKTIRKARFRLDKGVKEEESRANDGHPERVGPVLALHRRVPDQDEGDGHRDQPDRHHRATPPPAAAHIVRPGGDGDVAHAIEHARHHPDGAGCRRADEEKRARPFGLGLRRMVVEENPTEDDLVEDIGAQAAQRIDRFLPLFQRFHRWSSFRLMVVFSVNGQR